MQLCYQIICHAKDIKEIKKYKIRLVREDILNITCKMNVLQ